MYPHKPIFLISRCADYNCNNPTDSIAGQMAALKSGGLSPMTPTTKKNKVRELRRKAREELLEQEEDGSGTDDEPGVEEEDTDATNTDTEDEGE